MGRLEGKNILITGASAGIGEACAREFAKEGSNLILAARRLSKLDELKADILKQHPNITIYTVALDVSDKENIDKVVPGLLEKVKHVDVLVNNAGLVIGLDRLLDTSAEAIDAMFNTNVKGLVFLTQAVLPGMLARQTGHIINLGSVAGKQSYGGGSIYCATKHAVDAITRALSIELVDTPLRVSQICPGMVKTEFSTIRFRGDQEKADNVYKGLQPLVGQDIAELIVFTASRPPHVNISDMLVFPTAQADSKTISRST
ncbi:hypothetical protein J3Q64DRAFT_1734017 [Phycomyces blakesleeanus]|uniref:NAD(P)-binding protein n=2 Tax=Phycomyces blakesleeanus TaxID=4837 RepID=A0A162TSY3_PHYB8|nr:hypothetical protein PHYBLDRAFT_126915 [Phycomyces blakesleeanus NRRL 1555(-)]OAD69543.1 hypothetical protein PHYBLDRAFT_126915 [Phycomyces blakesleeanus NRRL 1555(-)]|eukprot:XP_018287583.1 hypothetical protein PHYBLDRAFT_126915 [Phycomyces blakesleeanus NRRL 1555(-)]